jgi:membrane-bound lytic murein transglycosylase A
VPRNTGLWWAGVIAASILVAAVPSKLAPTANATSPTVVPANPAASMKNAGSSFAPVAFSDLPGWADDDHAAALKTFLISCPKLDAKAKAAITKPGRVQVPAGFVEACEAAAALPKKVTRLKARAFFEKHFQPHRVFHKSPQGLFTGYWEPFLEGSRKREGKFQTPIHKRPADLVTLVAETDRGTVGNNLTHARQTKAGMLPFATRAEIDGGALEGQALELIYLADPVEVFFLQIQGSGRIRLTDGTTIRVHYDGKNGHPYTSIGRYLIDSGLLAADKVSMGALGRWLRADPSRGRLVMQQNASYVFFRELADGAGGPLGALEVPLVAGRSLAVDPSVHVLGSPIYISAPSLTHALEGKPYNRLMIAQDVGSAIKGPERGDIFFGSGERAGRIAGITKHPGHFFALLPGAPEARVAPAAAKVVPDKAPR